MFFGATKATVTSASSTSLTVSVPTGATYDYITVNNTASNLMASSPAKFTPIYSPAKTGFTISDLAAKVDFTTGNNPFAVAIGDLDGDGKPDLVVANYVSNTVSVYRNTSSSGNIGSGSFAAKVDFVTGTSPISVAIGDLDGDGKPDLVILNLTSNTVSVYRNTSTTGSIVAGSFAPKVDFATGTGPQSVAIGDLDGDGKPDLAVANYGASTVSVFRNTSSSGSIVAGSFAAKVDFTTGYNPYSVAIGDLDGDGKPDLATANFSSSTVSVFRNTSSTGSIGSGSFATNVDFVTGTSPISVAIGDLDGDGKLDLAVANYGASTVSVLRNTSSSGSIVAGSFAAKVDFATGTNPSSVAIGDLDGDGKPDLAVANFSSNNVSVFRNTSSSGSIVAGSFAPKVDFTTGTRPSSVAIGDLDGDGKPDLAAANYGSNTVSVLQNIYLPTITSFSPTSGNIGSLVTITGTNLSSPTGLTIGGVAAIPISNTGTSLVAMVMPGATTGAVSVTTAGGTANGTGNFNVTASQAPNSQQGNKLVGTGAVGTAYQGASVSLSADGNTAIVGGYLDNNFVGAAWVYTRSGGSWSQQGNKLVGTGAVGNAQQGISVSLSADGNTAIVGGYGDNNFAGAAWVFTRSGGSWSQQGSKLVGTGAVGTAQQGYSVSLSADGNTAIVGGYFDNTNTGAAWIFTRSGGIWSQQGSKLVGTGAVGTAQQGYSVSLSADGNTAIVGGFNDNSGAGAAWIYTRSGGSWSQQGSKLVGTGAVGAAEQGISISLSADGNTAIVGGSNDNNGAGAAWVFTRSGGSWSQQSSKLVGTGAVGAANQGISASLSADANTAIVGGYGDNSFAGAAWVYVYVPTPTITTTGTLAAVNTTYGSASSSPTSFTVSGSNLTNDISINSPNGFEISSTSSSSGYASSITLTQSGGTVNTTTIYVRLKATATVAASPYSGNVVCSSTGATSQNVATASSTVSAAALTITANAANKTYGSTLTGAAGSTSFTSSGLVNSETIGSVTVAYGTGAAATASVGTYTGSVTPSAATGGTFTASNYNITYATGNIVVGQAALTITANTANKTYGSTLSGAAGSTSFTSSGLVNSETIGSVTIAYGTGAAATAAVGTYTGSVTPSAATGGTFTASNYNITYATGNIVVGQATLTITASAASKTYGTVASLTAYTTSGLVNSDAVNALTLSSTGTAATAAVGTYNIVPSGATGTGLTNYAITYTNGTLTVNQATLTITASAASKTYGTVASLTAYTTSGLVGTDAVSGLTLSSTGTAATANVGTYDIVPSGATGTGLTNYAITYTNGTLTVNQAALTITASAASKTYGTVASLTAYTTSGLVGADAVNGLTLSSTGTAATANVGTYNIIPSGATGTGLANYAITYTNGTLTVNQAALTITASVASKTYGTVASLTAYTTSGLVGTDAVSGLTLSSTGSPSTAIVGSYNIVPSGATGTGLTNYAITYTNGTLTVNQATLTITASAASKTYGTVASLTAYTTSGLVGTDAVSGLTLSSTGTAATANVGTYDIVPSGATGTGLTNYAITYTNGTLTVNQATLTITASAASKTYGTVASLTAYTTSGLVGTDAVSGLTLSSTGTAATAAVGTYNIVPSGATGTGLTNYAITYTNGTLTVNQAPLTITATNQSKCFGLNLTLPANGYSVNGLLNSDAVSSVTLSSSGATGTAAINTYPITISNATGTGLSNYNISYANGVLNVIASATITTQPITTLAQCAGTSAQISVSATGSPNFSYQWLLNGTAINGATNSTYTVPSLTAANAGSYTVIVTPTGGCAPVTSNASVWTVNALPVPGAITIPSPVCTGTGYTLTNSLSGGVWSSSNTGVATINASGGLVTPISQGNTTISYVVTDNFGCTGTVTALLPVLSTPVKPVITRDFSGNLNSSYTGVNIWYNASNQQTVSGVSSSSYNPRANIRVQVQGNNGGCIGPWSDEFVYTTSSIATLYPNPASSYTVASIVSDRAQSITLQLTDMAGKVLQEIPVTLGTGQNPVRINTAALARGAYMLVIKGSGVTYQQFVKE